MVLESAALFLCCWVFLPSISRHLPSVFHHQLLCHSSVPCPPERSEGSGVLPRIISALLLAFGLGSFAVLRMTRDEWLTKLCKQRSIRAETLIGAGAWATTAGPLGQKKTRARRNKMCNFARSTPKLCVANSCASCYYLA